MTLNEIRNASSLESLKPAIAYLCTNMQAMAWGEFQAYKRTLEDQAAKVGSDLKTINELALEFQTFGVI